jgi:hypothetical protein
MNVTVEKLELKLGPDTSDLALRVGLHSGPVTAGVLRGERARFQLFGDTLNTAARIERSGLRNKIHLSQETADLLIEAGKEHWLEPREDIFIAKGKGALHTFWLRMETNKVAATSSEEAGGTAGKTENEDAGGASEAFGLGLDQTEIAAQTAYSKKAQNLIDWNAELLLKLLKKVVARRQITKKDGEENTGDRVKEMQEVLGEGGTAIEEIVEIITMPKFDTNKNKEEVDPNTIDLGDNVAEQLRDYVSVLASMYRDNPFHCFEHASHVTMSVNKLLSRIVASDAVDADGGKGQKDLASALHDHTYGITSDPLTQFAVVMSAVMHDVDHRGVSNIVLAKEDPILAEVYNCKSVAEQNSIDLAWNALMAPNFEDLRKCIYEDEVELNRFRQLIVNSVMATDIFDKDLGALRKNRWNKAFHEDQSEDTEDQQINRKATIVIEHLIQASDVAHTMQHWQVYQKWNARLFRELYTAYREGRTENDPTAGWYKGELGFFDNYIIPLTKKLKECGVFGVSSDEYLNYALENRREWETKGEAIVSNLVIELGWQVDRDAVANETKEN